MNGNVERGGSEMYLSPREKSKEQREKLGKMVKDIALLNNKEAYDRYGLQGLLDAECQIKPQGYIKILGKELVDESDSEVHERELEFSDAQHPGMQRYYKTEYGIEGEENIIAKWRQETSEKPGNQTELAVTALLHKILGDRYFIVRTAKYDDYHNGIDNLIVDKETGVVICAFDEFHEGGTGDSTESKYRKLPKTAMDGGAELRFGLKMEDGKLQRASLENLPVFYLGLNAQELQELTETMITESMTELSEKESLIYKKLISTVGTQMNILQNQKLPEGVSKNLHRFAESFEALNNYPKN